MQGKYLSLKSFLLWRQLPRPCVWATVFERPQPLVLEIGFGNGEYLVRQALAQPECNFVGLELHWQSIRRTLRRLAQSSCPNVRLVQADARVVLERLFRPQSLERFYSLFPCPWPKRAHERHRLFSPAFWRLLNSRLQADGTGLIVTDHEALHEQIVANLAGTGFAAEVRRAAPAYNTKYERRWAEAGQSEFFEIHVRKLSHMEIPEPEEVELVTFHVPQFEAEKFSPASLRGPVAVEFKRFLFDPGRKTGMVLATVAEDGLTQCFWIEILKDEHGWAISPAPGGGVIPTRAVYQALEQVRDAALTSSGSQQMIDRP